MPNAFCGALQSFIFFISLYWNLLILLLANVEKVKSTALRNL